MLNLRQLEMQFGLGIQSDKSPAEYGALARLAESGGFDVVSVYHDLLYQPAIAPLLLIAQATERVRVGPAALNPYTLHPVEIAGQIAALDLVSDGRAYLGLVQGAWLDALGLSEDRPLTALREAVTVIARLFAGNRDGFVGERFTLAPGWGFQYEPRRREVPLLLGTWGKRTAAFAAEAGAAELKLGGSANPELVPLVRDWIGSDDVGIVLGAVTVVDEDGDAARARARAAVELYLPVVASRDPTLGLAAGEDPPLDRFVFAGTPTEVIAHAERAFAAGASRIEFGTPTGLTTAHGVELLARHVLPHFR
ncbi:MAG: LLM class flavin-dependent oxidoreductase [Actinobacteria bacterium]|nr:LLM class flavin-dependent oxidoreductase [Actinomycetota bacterium]